MPKPIHKRLDKAEARGLRLDTVVGRWIAGALLGMAVAIAATAIGFATAVANGDATKGEHPWRTWGIVISITLVIAAIVGAIVLELWLHIRDLRDPPSASFGDVVDEEQDARGTSR